MTKNPDLGHHGGPKAVRRRLAAVPAGAARRAGAVLLLRAKIVASRRKILRALEGSPDVTFITNPGNVGDHLIRAGARRLLSGVPYEEVKLGVREGYGVSGLEALGGHTALVTGGGGWCRPFHRVWPHVFSEIEERFQKVVVLPSTVDTSFDLVREAISGTKALFFARERESYRQLQKLCATDLALDTAFFYDFGPYMGHRGEGILRAYRRDPEADGVWTPPGNEDIALTCGTLDEFMWKVARAESVRTDRAHVMIAAAMLGKRVEYRASNYHKVPSIAEYSLKGFPISRLPDKGTAAVSGVTAARAARGRQPAEAARPPSPFVVGTGRSGTTLLRLMLDAHPDLTIPPETHFIARAARLSGQASGRPGGRRAAFLEAVIRNEHWAHHGLDAAELRRRVAAIDPFDLGEAARAFYGLYAEKAGKPRWGDKTPGYLRHMPLIRGALPEARFVHVVRDGRDVALSYKDVWFGPGSVEESARRWRDEIEEARRQAPGLGGAYMEVFYEDLVSEPGATLREVCGLVDLAWDPAMLRYHERAEARMGEIDSDVLGPEGEVVVSGEERKTIHALTREPPRKDRAGRWRREMAEEDLRRFEQIAGATLRELGYELGYEAG